MLVDSRPISVDYSGEAVRSRRKYLRLSIAEVAEAIRISAGRLSQIERGINSPTAEELVRLKKVLAIKKFSI